MEKEMEQWTDDVMNSLSGLQHTRAPRQLQQRILDSVHQATIIKLPVATRWAMAAGVALLIVANVFSVLRHSNTGKATGKNAGAEMIVNEYFNNNINL